MNFCAVLGSYPKDNPGGAEFQAYLIAAELADRGWTSHYVAHRSTDGTTEVDDGIRVHRLEDASTREKLATLAATDADVYYFRNIADLPLAALTRYSLDGTVVFNVSHDRHCTRLLSGWPGKPSGNPVRVALRRGYLAVLRSLLVVPDRLFVQTRRQRRLLESNRGLSGTLVGNGHPVPEADPTKADPPVVLWLASLKPWKRPDLFLDAAERCRDLPCRFWVVGRPDVEEVAAEVRERAARIDGVEYKGGCDIEESNEYLARASVFVNTSENEGFPNTFIQAWLRETPVLSLGVDPDGVLRDGECGYLAEDAADLASQVRTLVTDPERRDRLGRRARAYAVENHAIERVVDRVEEALAAADRGTGQSSDPTDAGSNPWT